jgi:hypothetical protein
MTTRTQPRVPEGDIRRNLLLSFPELDVAHDGRDVIDALAEGAICHLLQTQGVERMLVLNDVASALRDIAGLSYEPAELVSAFERLERRGRLSFRDQTHRSFVYDESAFRTTADAFQHRMSAWDAVRTSWMDEIRHRHGLDEEQARVLWDALDEFATSLINGYSAEAAAFLYLIDAAGQTRFYEALQMRLPLVKEAVPEGLGDVAEEEFPRFFDPSNAARADYLTARLRAGFFFHLLSVDPTASRLVREQVSEKDLYLDSNFLFRLIGFHGPSLAFTPMTVVEISRALNCRLVVARETVDEFIRVVRANIGHLKSVPITRETYLSVAAEHPSDEGDFMAAYYREYHSGRVKSPEEFGRKWSNVRTFIREWSIEIDEEAYVSDDARESTSFVDEMSRLQQWHQGSKNPAAVEHDVAMLRIVRDRRGRVDATSADVRVWFLTFDRQLTRYSAYYATEEHLPAVLLAEDWLQIARPFLPRTDDYAKSFIAMLRTPILLQGSNKVPFSHMAEALSRLERYQELPEQVIAAMVADDQFTRSFLEAKSEEASRAVIELKVGALAADAINLNESLHEQLETVKLQLAAVSENVDSLRDARDLAELDRDRARRDANEDRAAAERRSEQHAAALRTEFGEKLQTAVSQARTGAAEDTKKELAPQINERISAARRWTAYFTLSGAVTLAGVIALVLRWDAWIPMQRTVVIVGVALAWATLLLIPKGPGVALGVTANAAGVIAMLLWGQSEWSKAEHQQSTRAVKATQDTTGVTNPAPSTSTPPPVSSVSGSRPQSKAGPPGSAQRSAGDSAGRRR